MYRYCTSIVTHVLTIDSCVVFDVHMYIVILLLVLLCPQAMVWPSAIHTSTRLTLGRRSWCGGESACTATTPVPLSHRWAGAIATGPKYLQTPYLMNWSPSTVCPRRSMSYPLTSTRSPCSTKASTSVTWAARRTDWMCLSAPDQVHCRDLEWVLCIYVHILTTYVIIYYNISV